MQLTSFRTMPLLILLAALIAGVAAAPVRAQQAAVTPQVYAALVFGAGTAAPPAPPSSLPSDWLGRLNHYRALAGLPPVTENAAWSAGAAAHSRYVVKNDELTHTENPAKPYYSAEGNAAGQSSNVLANGRVTASDAEALDGWMQAPFHALGMIDPKLAQSAFGSYREADGGFQMAATLDVIRGRNSALAASTTYPVYFPANGLTLPYTSYGGGEYPDPLTSCSGYQVPTGAPLYVLFGSGSGAPTVTASSLTQGGQSLAHCVYSETTYSNPDGSAQSLARSVMSSRDAVVIIPRAPLLPGATYAVSLTVGGVTRSWTFSVALDAAPSTLGIAEVAEDVPDALGEPPVEAE